MFNFKHLWDSLRAAMRQRRMSVRSDKLVSAQEWSSSNKLVMSSSPLPPLVKLQIVKEQLNMQMRKSQDWRKTMTVAKTDPSR